MAAVSTAAPGQDIAGGRPSGLFGLFARSHLAAVQTLLSGAGTQLPSGAATIVSRSLDNWADWIDVNSARIKSPGGADTWSPDADVGAARAARPGLGLAVGAHRRPGGGRAAEHGRLGAGRVVHRPGGPG